MRATPLFDAWMKRQRGGRQTLVFDTMTPEREEAIRLARDLGDHLRRQNWMGRGVVIDGLTDIESIEHWLRNDADEMRDFREFMRLKGKLGL